MRLLERFLPPLLLSFLGGVFLASVGVTPPWLLPLFGFFALLFLLLSMVERTLRVFMVTVLFVGLSLGVLRFTSWDAIPNDPILQSAIGSRVTLEGVVTDEPDVRETKTHLAVSVSLLRAASTTQPVSGNIIVFADRYPEYRYGDQLVLEGALRVPEPFAKEDGTMFDYPAYLKGKGIRYQMSYASITQTGKDEGHPVIAALLAIKHTFSGAIDRALPSPESALLSGLLLGGKQSLGAEWIERFQTAGIIHIVVLSGYNMSIVAEWLVVAFRFLGFFGSLSVGALGIVLFALMTGAGATVVRAAILALLVLLAKATGKTSEMGRALLFAGATMVAVNPSLLSFDPSFQLSFLASLGLVFVAPILDTRIGLWKGSRLWREVLISTLATQVTVLPLLLFQTGMLSLVALPANLLVLPLIPLSMLLGFLAGVGALLFPFLASLFGAPVFLPLAFIFVVAEYAAQIPYAAVPFSLSAFWTFLCYGVLLWWVIRERSRMTSAVPQTVPSLALPPLGSPEPGACDKKETQ